MSSAAVVANYFLALLYVLSVLGLTELYLAICTAAAPYTGHHVAAICTVLSGGD